MLFPQNLENTSRATKDILQLFANPLKMPVYLLDGRKGPNSLPSHPGLASIIPFFLISDEHTEHIILNSCFLVQSYSYIILLCLPTFLMEM